MTYIVARDSRVVIKQGMRNEEMRNRIIYGYDHHHGINFHHNNYASVRMRKRGIR